MGFKSAREVLVVVAITATREVVIVAIVGTGDLDDTGTHVHTSSMHLDKSGIALS